MSKYYEIIYNACLSAIFITTTLCLFGCVSFEKLGVNNEYQKIKKHYISLNLFERYYEMAKYINNTSLPVDVSYCGLINSDYVIRIDTDRKSWLGFLGDEEIATIQYVAITQKESKKSDVIFPINPMTQSEMKHLPHGDSLPEIYEVWRKLQLPMPILSKATLDNWPSIPNNSILLPDNARIYNSKLKDTTTK